MNRNVYENSAIVRSSGTQIIGNRFHLIKRLGCGGNGVTYLCNDVHANYEQVVLKVMYPLLSISDDDRVRIFREYIAASRVNHPYVVRPFQFYDDADFVGFTMEYVPGGDLAEHISKLPDFGTLHALALLARICDGVQAIHLTGIIHGDLKPENILVSANCRPKISDFGVAFGRGIRKADSTMIEGTLKYLSPEYLSRGTMDWRSDIFAIGVIGYEMFTGRVPFLGSNMAEIIHRRKRAWIVPPNEIIRSLNPQLSSIICHALAHDPKARYQSAREMARDLWALAKDEMMLLERS